MSEVGPACRSCGRGDLSPVLSLGWMPLANALITSEQLQAQEPTYPLDLMFCSGCTLVQKIGRASCRERVYVLV